MQVHAETTPWTTNSAVVGNYNIDRTANLSFGNGRSLRRSSLVAFASALGVRVLKRMMNMNGESRYLDNATYMFYRVV